MAAKHAQEAAEAAAIAKAAEVAKASEITPSIKGLKYTLVRKCESKFPFHSNSQLHGFL